MGCGRYAYKFRMQRKTIHHINMLFCIYYKRSSRPSVLGDDPYAIVTPAQQQQPQHHGTVVHTNTIHPTNPLSPTPLMGYQPNTAAHFPTTHSLPPNPPPQDATALHAIIRKAAIDSNANTAYLELEDLLNNRNTSTTSVDINGVDARGATPLHIALALGINSIFIERLLEAGGACNARTPSQNTVLHVAAQHGRAEILPLLCGVPGIEIDALNIEGNTPLHDAVVRAALHTTTEENTTNNNKGSSSDSATTMGYNNDEKTGRGDERTSAVDVACILLDHGADPCAPASEGGTVLHLIAANGLVGLLQKIVSSWNEKSGTVAPLILAEELMRVTDEDGNTPLHSAAAAGQETAAVLLLAAAPSLANAKNNFAQTPCDMAMDAGHEALVACLASTSLLHAAYSNDILGLQSALSVVGSDWNSTTDAHGNTALHQAAQSDGDEVLLYLLSTSSDSGSLARQQNSVGDTPLHIAARKGQAKTLHRLLSTSTGPGFAAALITNDDGATPLHLAALSGSIAAAQEIINAEETAHGVSRLLSQGDHNENTPLHYAAGSGHLEMVELLIARGSIVNARNAMDDTPLHVAVMHDNSPVVERLCDSQADPLAANREAKTPIDMAGSLGRHGLKKVMLGTLLLRAASRGDAAGVHEAIGQGAMMTYHNGHRDTALHLAAQGGHVAVIEYLIASNMPLHLKSFVHGDEPLHVATRNGMSEAVKMLARAPGSNVNAVNGEGDTSLHICAQEGWIEALTVLLHMPSIDVNAVQLERHCTPLHDAVCQSDLEAVKLLVAHGADPNAKDGLGGDTAMHFAIRWVHRDSVVAMLHALIEAGGKLDEVNGDGVSVADMAISIGHESLVVALPQLHGGRALANTGYSAASLRDSHDSAAYPVTSQYHATGCCCFSCRGGGIVDDGGSRSVHTSEHPSMHSKIEIDHGVVDAVAVLDRVLDSSLLPGGIQEDTTSEDWSQAAPTSHQHPVAAATIDGGALAGKPPFERRESPFIRASDVDASSSPSSTTSSVATYHSARAVHVDAEQESIAELMPRRPLPPPPPATPLQHELHGAIGASPVGGEGAASAAETLHATAIQGPFSMGDRDQYKSRQMNDDRTPATATAADGGGGGGGGITVLRSARSEQMDAPVSPFAVSSSIALASPSKNDSKRNGAGGADTTATLDTNTVAIDARHVGGRRGDASSPHGNVAVVKSTAASAVKNAVSSASTVHSASMPSRTISRISSSQAHAVAAKDLLIQPDELVIYRDKLIGDGSFGNVYMGSHWGKKVAIKVLLPQKDGYSLDQLDAIQEQAVADTKSAEWKALQRVSRRREVFFF